MAEVKLENINKVYPNGFQATYDLSIDVADGEFLVLVGPSGCGKSTALRMVAGLEEISSGTLKIDDRVVNDVEPKDRDIAMVFQNYALYPHMTVADNIGFALKLAKLPKAEIKERVERAASILDLNEQLDRKPGQLSGGQRQRVAMGRAIVRQPKAFLMDEPLSNLDAKLRVAMRAEIASLQRELGVTTLYVTHDQVEAMTMGDRVAVLNKGYLMQVDSPQDLYDSPANVFVAGFIGSPSMNLMEGELSGTAESPVVKIGSISIAVPSVEGTNIANYLGKKLVVGLRPEDMEDASTVDDAPAERSFATTARLVESLGSEVIVHFGLDAEPYIVADAIDDEAEAGLSNDDETATFVARVSPRSPVRNGNDITLVIDAGRFHYFDIESGQAVR
ncbi:MAG: sn-glycerol-3-phosphate ABC transporter ATP-binding protein UgpC [Acidimicrobiia bacterium]|nr:sn-glycerol-3-phosphate ABC transporter ATP-binding protein UgpC [Acidimicrobiia bacterium]